MQPFFRERSSWLAGQYRPLPDIGGMVPGGFSANATEVESRACACRRSSSTRKAPSTGDPVHHPVQHPHCRPAHRRHQGAGRGARDWAGAFSLGGSSTRRFVCERLRSIARSRSARIVALSCTTAQGSSRAGGRARRGPAEAGRGRTGRSACPDQLGPPQHFQVTADGGLREVRGRTGDRKRRAAPPPGS